MLVQLERPGERAVTFRELPPAMDSVDFAANLRVAVEDAEAQAAELNRRLAPGPAGPPGAPISSMGTSSQPRSRRRVWWSPWRSTSAPMYTPSLPLAHHRVPHRRRVARALDRSHGRGGGSSAGQHARRRASWRWVAT